MNKQFIEKLYQKHTQANSIPSRTAISRFTEGLLEFLFPQLSEKHYKNSSELEVVSNYLNIELKGILVNIENKLEKEPDIITPLPFDERLLRDVHPLDKTTGRRKQYRQYRP